jgi:hypothetical protein
MFFANITSERKMEILLSAKANYEELIYDSVLRIGFDPDEFDSETFDPLSELIPNGSEEIIATINRALNGIDLINRQISFLG